MIGKEPPTYKKHHKFRCKNGNWCYIPLKLKGDLDILIDDMMYEEMDIVIVIDGKEGTGKSRDARIIGKYIESITGVPFGAKHIHLTTDDYMKSAEDAVSNKIKFQINVLDESRQALNRKRGMSKSNVKFSNYLSECRDAQQVHIILLPAVHDLENYITMWRMSLLIHKIKGHRKNNQRRSGYSLLRGYFKVFQNCKHLQQVIFNRTKYGYYAYPQIPKYRAKMIDAEPFTEKELTQYKNLKAAKRKEKYAEEEKKISNELKTSYTKELQSIKGMMEKGITTTEIGKMWGVSGSAVSHRTSFLNKALSGEA